MLIAGVDEVGRGPLAGPVIAAAVILPVDYHLPGLTDSKKLSASKREVLCELIYQQAIAIAVGRADVAEIDALNILQASLLAMSRAVAALSQVPDHVLVDGHIVPPLTLSCEAIIGGDAKIPQISAASIVAKVHRDREMQDLDKIYPGYGFAKHVGYPTASHLTALQVLGPSAIHRRSFAPVRAALRSIHVRQVNC